jgi:hypothetical protein
MAAASDQMLRPLDRSLIGLVLARCVSSASEPCTRGYDVDQVLRELGLATGQLRESLLRSLRLWAPTAGATIEHCAGYRAGKLLVPAGAV